MLGGCLRLTDQTPLTELVIAGAMRHDPFAHFQPLAWPVRDLSLRPRSELHKRTELCLCAREEVQD